jgi:integrase/uncharacterized coiled-coil protein SlyX
MHKRKIIELSSTSPSPEPAWNIPQQRLLSLLQQKENRQIPLKALLQKADVSEHVWYQSIKDPQFVAAVEALGITVKRQGEKHIQVELAVHPEEELAKDIWDMRRLKADYPKHRDPNDFKVDFTWIANPLLRQQVKDYFRHRLPRWEAKTFPTALGHLTHFLTLLPLEIHVGTLDRKQVEKRLPKLNRLSDYAACRCLQSTRAMLTYMATSPAWSGVRPSRFLIWDAILILRHTGMRAEDLTHLKSPDEHGRNGCLDQDSEGYWWIRLHHSVSKMNKDHRIPTRTSDGVIEAVRRQQARVHDTFDHFGEHYLFRHKQGVLTYDAIKKALGKLTSFLTYENHPYRIAPHQFRHSLATDMIEQGVDIHTVKEFLGHKSLAMTERYVKVYLTSLKAKYDAYRIKKQQTYATEMMANQVQMDHLENETDGGWMEGKVGKLYISPLPDGIGNCAHLAMLDPCPTPPHCPTCPKLRANNRHLPVWENKARNLLITVEALRENPAYARARQKHELELRHAEKVIAALRRRLEELKQQLANKDNELRQKQRDLDRLYGKLAAASPLTDAELRCALTEALERLKQVAEPHANTEQSKVLNIPVILPGQMSGQTRSG